MNPNKRSRQYSLVKVVIIVLTVLFFCAGSFIVWAVTLPIPDFNAFFSETNLTEGTKIYDRTGKVVLYDIHGDVRRVVVPYDQISGHIKDATVAIEDENFYNEKYGLSITGIARSAFRLVFEGGIHGGGSTITQQVIKNVLLRNENRYTRKIKELILAPKLEQSLSKDKILNLYLNAVPYGGNTYGIEQASIEFFGKHAKDLDLAESSYLAALPQAPSRLSPYGNSVDQLEARKNIVLQKMYELKKITKEEYTAAKAEKVVFQPPQNHGIKAPHFVFFIKSYLEDKYGKDVVENNNLKVITTIDWSLQQKAEAIAKDYGNRIEKNFNAHNNSLVAIDPKTGQILTMVGSRDYYDIENQGNFNIAIAHRQPGSSFKPFVYATAFNKGYTPDTVLFDLPTQFDTSCGQQGGSCYAPQNYDNKFVGPISLRNALAQSRNVPAIKLLYLAGIKDSITTAESMGIQSLGDPKRYGLTLVLGGGEVSLLDMTSAYSVFANEGDRNPYTGILKVEDGDGNVLEEYQPNTKNVLPTNTTRLISSVLSDNNARIPAYGAESPLYFPGRDVAVKTGTTNDYRDVWIMGYTPDIAIGAWAGNNDNSPMVKKVAGTIIAPEWHAFMEAALLNYPVSTFTPPEPTRTDIKPILRGVWQGGQISNVDVGDGSNTTIINNNVHSILYWVDKSDPLGPPPANPSSDYQFSLWEGPVRAWANANGYIDGTQTDFTPPSQAPTSNLITINSPVSGSHVPANNLLTASFSYKGVKPISQVDFAINDTYAGTLYTPPYLYSFVPSEIENIKDKGNTLTISVYDSTHAKSSASVTFDLDR